MADFFFIKHEAAHFSSWILSLVSANSYPNQPSLLMYHHWEPAAYLPFSIWNSLTSPICLQLHIAVSAKLSPHLAPYLLTLPTFSSVHKTTALPMSAVTPFLVYEFVASAGWNPCARFLSSNSTLGLIQPSFRCFPVNESALTRVIHDLFLGKSQGSCLYPPPAWPFCFFWRCRSPCLLWCLILTEVSDQSLIFSCQWLFSDLGSPLHRWALLKALPLSCSSQFNTFRWSL